MKNDHRFATLIACAVLLWESPVYAYLDPGGGSLLLQTLIAGALGGLYAVKHFWRRMRDSASAALSRFSRHG